jgi:serine/threonine-protein kinase
MHQIAAGTLGPVFRAYQPELDKLVAVKLFRLPLPPEKVHQLAAALESLVGADLTHPAIATPIAAGITGASAYLVQDFVAADSLDIVMRDHGAAPPTDAVRIATQLAGALDFAAVVSVYHGALHPKDVLVTADETRLGSLGIASILERVGVPTPVRRPYSAPERMAGGAWDRRADVFSLAAITAELLWGRRLTATGEEAARTLTELPGGDLVRLQQVFARALADDPADRFPTALAFADALRGAITIEPVETAAESFEPPTLPFDEVEPSPQPPLPVSTATLSDFSPETSSRFAVADAVPARDTFAGPHGDPLPVAAGPPPPATHSSDPARSAIWPLLLALVVGVALGAGAAIMVLSGREDRRDVAGPDNAPAAVAAPEAGAKPASVPPSPTEASAAASAAAAPSNAGPPSPASVAPATTAESRPPGGPGAAPSQKPRAGRIVVRSTPPGARAFLDGRPIGVTPATVSGLAAGTYTVRVSNEGYTEARQRVIVSNERPTQSLTVELVRNPPLPTPSPRQRNGRYLASLRVETRPAGAQVFLDGRLVGTSPMVLNEVSVGEHAIRFELPNHRPWTASIRVVAGEANRVAASLDSN